MRPPIKASLGRLGLFFKPLRVPRPRTALGFFSLPPAVFELSFRHLLSLLRGTACWGRTKGVGVCMRARSRPVVLLSIPNSTRLHQGSPARQNSSEASCQKPIYVDKVIIYLKNIVEPWQERDSGITIYLSCQTPSSCFAIFPHIANTHHLQPCIYPVYQHSTLARTSHYRGLRSQNLHSSPQTARRCAGTVTSLRTRHSIQPS